jgi:hypothetical protein
MFNHATRSTEKVTMNHHNNSQQQKPAKTSSKAMGKAKQLTHAKAMGEEAYRAGLALIPVCDEAFCSFLFDPERGADVRCGGASVVALLDAWRGAWLGAQAQAREADNEPLFSAADLIHSYTRADAIEDGMLVDVSGAARDAGFLIPVAVTRSVWFDCIEWDESDSERTGQWEVQALRLERMLRIAAAVARQRRENSSAPRPFHIIRTPRTGPTTRTASLVLRISGGDEWEPVITITHENED